MAANTLSKKAKRHAARKAAEEEKPEGTEQQEQIVQDEQENDESVASDQEVEDASASDQEEEETPYQPKNDTDGMLRLLDRIKLDLPWIETMDITSSKPIEIDAEKEGEELDMARELAFYQQALEAARLARDKFKKLNIPFSRPDDYFAEMIKSDEHMAKVRQRLLDESAKQKASEEARRQRQLKKFGKKVQVEKQLERQKQKTQMLDKIKLLKRSKQRVS
ncbi:eukaryotic rRNA processing [Hesseltinella vesiculosa]|uniref:Eukaryotic rRNA processing n=1 Tax=Hesseltinella vesiculosa TaxID=101127 RepID=A0A1X2G4C5_9FUNG|nr:eukaryotic rRNA processing [Hesseltinella vesiculosa]